MFKWLAIITGTLRSPPDEKGGYSNCKIAWPIIVRKRTAVACISYLKRLEL